MPLRYPALAGVPENGTPNVKSDAAQAGSILPLVKVEGVPVRFVATGKTTRSGIPIVAVLASAAGGES